jgi:hypothetical protein
MESAPKDGTPILAWCIHEADPHFTGAGLTLYGAHAEGMWHVVDGPHVIQWGDSWTDDNGYMPDWWFQYGSEFEITANPVRWMPCPKPEGLE